VTGCMIVNKVKFTLEHARSSGWGERKCSSILSLKSAPDCDWWTTPIPGRFTPGKRPGTYCIGCMAGPSTWLQMYGKSRLQRNSIPGRVI